MGKSKEVNSTRTMVDRVEERFGVKPQRLVGDTAYGTAPLLGLDGRRKADRSSRSCVGQDGSQRRKPVDRQDRSQHS